MRSRTPRARSACQASGGQASALLVDQGSHQPADGKVVEFGGFPAVSDAVVGTLETGPVACSLVSLSAP